MAKENKGGIEDYTGKIFTALSGCMSKDLEDEKICSAQSKIYRILQDFRDEIRGYKNGRKGVKNGYKV